MRKILSFSLAAFLVAALLSFAVFAVNEENAPRTLRNTIVSDRSDLVIDYAELISDSAEAELQSRLTKIREEKNFDIVIVTVNTLDDKTPRDYADDFYDYNEYGCGENFDGCLLLIHIGEGPGDRNIYISTSGSGILCLNDDTIYDMCYAVRDYYIEDRLEYGLNSFVSDVLYNINAYENRFNFKPVYLLFGAIAGLVVAFIVRKVLTSKMKTVRFKASANDYYDADSMRITGSYDRFVGKHVITRVKETSSSGGGSSTHTSSSGHSHGGGGISF